MVTSAQAIPTAVKPPKVKLVGAYSPALSPKFSKSAPKWPVWLGGVVFTLVVGLGISLQFIKKDQDIRQQAAQTDNQISLNWRGQTQGDKLVIEVLLNTKQYSIAGAELRGTLTGVKSSSVVVNTANPVGLQPVFNDIKDQSGANATTFEVSLFAPLSTTQPVTTQNNQQVITTFTIANPPSSGVTAAFDGSTIVPAMESGVTLQLGGNQTFTWQSPAPSPTTTSDSSKKSCDQNCATDTECQSSLICYKGRCRANADKEDARCTAVADNGLNRTCNQYCADGRECQSQYVCYFNQCRNPKNVTNANCSNPPSPTPKTQASTSGKGGAVRTSPSPSPTPVVVAQRVTFSSPSPSPAASVSATPRATSSAMLRTSPSPTALTSPKSSPRPTITPLPVAEEKPASAGWGRILLAGVAILAGLGLFAFSLLKLFRK